MPTAPQDDILAQLDNKFLNILFMRHGQACVGPSDDQVDFGLTQLGQRQAKQLGKRLAKLPLDCLYSSDMPRSYQTAQAIAHASPQVHWEALPDLREISPFHMFEHGHTPTPDKAQQRLIGQELEIVQGFIQKLYTQHHPGQLVAVASHGYINRVIFGLLGGFSMKETLMTSHCHASMTAIKIDKKHQASFCFINHTRHLPVSLISNRNITVSSF